MPSLPRSTLPARLLPAALVALATLAVAPSAAAFTTRIHIVIANGMRDALIANGGDAIPLRMGDRSVGLSAEDADAIRNQPLAFRAGAIGPDNTVFPALTDGTHGVEQDPFGQCELLYREAFTEAERAYALGCFVHGASDAVAHHFVNYFAGETFTLNPITAARTSGYNNAIRHIVVESMVQDGAYGLRPTAFSAGAMQHAIPHAFVLRAYFDERSPVWQRMSRDARARFETARRAMPGAELPTLLASSGLAPVEHVIMAPVYLREIDARRVALRAAIQAELVDMQNPRSTRGSQLRVGAGPDGRLGTRDDTTACSTSCAGLFARYHTFARILMPRYDAGGRELPSAFDKVSDRLGSELGRFLPSLVQTIENISLEFNRALTGADSSFGVDAARLPALLAPMRTWARDLTTVDYETVGRAVAPDWYSDLSDFFSRLGVSVSIPDLMRAIFEPIIVQVRTAIERYVTDLAEDYVTDILSQYRTQLSSTRTEFNRTLSGAAPAGLTGNALTHFFDSGLYAHAFNLSATALARHEVVLPRGEPIETGPASFDASYTLEWTEAGLCDHLRPHVFPLGLGVRALLSVRDNRDHPAVLAEDSPIECHDGSLTRFGAPSPATCAHTNLVELVASSDRRGSITRAFPPDYVATRPGCARLSVPGLPEPPPPEEPDAGVIPEDASVEVDAEVGSDAEAPDVRMGSDAGADSAAPRADAGPMTTPMPGCHCSVPASGRGTVRGGGALLLALAVVASTRRRRRAKTGAGIVAALSLGACSAEMGTVDSARGDDASQDVAADVDFGMDAEEPFDVQVMDVPRDTARPDVPVPMDTARPDVPTDTPRDVPPAMDVPDLRRLLAAELGDSVWQGSQTRTEGTRRVTRQYELRFRASSLQWAEVRNPFGPSRFRTMRAFNIDRDGSSVDSIIMNPPDWERHPDMGLRENWTFDVVAGSPRRLRITNEAGATETFTEGAVAAPTSGLTAEVRVFATGGPMDEAFCGVGTFTGPNRPVIWDFARGRSSEPSVAYDVVAGARLETWRDTSGMNRFGVTDVHGFGLNGGTHVTDQFNFIVRYTGVIRHPGGGFALRERDDDVLDALWAFSNSRVGSLDPTLLQLEVHGHAPADATGDEPSVNITPGNVPIEIMVLRCRADIGGQDVDVQIRLGGTSAPWTLVGATPSAPSLSAELFPPVL